jgi:hypothetical protein
MGWAAVVVEVVLLERTLRAAAVGSAWSSPMAAFVA